MFNIECKKENKNCNSKYFKNRTIQSIHLIHYSHSVPFIHLNIYHHNHLIMNECVNEQIICESKVFDCDYKFYRVAVNLF